MFKMSSEQLAKVKKDYPNLIMPYTPEPEPEKERKELERLYDRLYKMDGDKFVEIIDRLTEDGNETEEYIESLREISGLY